MEPRFDPLEGGAKPKRKNARKSAPKRKTPRKSAPKRKTPRKSAPKKKSPRKSPKKSAPKKKSPRKSAPKRTSKRNSPQISTGGMVYFTFKFTPLEQTPPAKTNWTAIQNEILARRSDLETLEQKLAKQAFETLLEDHVRDIRTQKEYVNYSDLSNEFDDRNAQWTFSVRVSSRLAETFQQQSLAALTKEFQRMAADSYQAGQEGIIELDNGKGYTIDLVKIKQVPDSPAIRALQERQLRVRATLQLMREENFDLEGSFSPFTTLALMKEQVSQLEALVKESIEQGYTLPSEAEIDALVKLFQQSEPMYH